MTDDLSDFGRINVIHADLIRKRNAATDPIERERLNTLIANIDGLKKEPDNFALKAMLAKNMRSFERYLAERGS
jgi:hypothetical protein